MRAASKAMCWSLIIIGFHTIKGCWRNFAKGREGRKALLQNKKRAGRDALLQKLCRPYLPANLDLILMAG
jgi:hypothetical protein